MRLKIFGVFVPFFLIFFSVNCYSSCNIEEMKQNYEGEISFSYDSNCNYIKTKTVVGDGVIGGSAPLDSSNYKSVADLYSKYPSDTYICFFCTYLSYGKTRCRYSVSKKAEEVIIIKNSDEIGDSDGDGVNDCLDQCPGTPDNVVVNSQGCPDPCVDSDGDGIPYAFDENVGLQDDYYFRYTTFMNSSEEITGYSILNENTGAIRKLGNPDVKNDVGFVSGRYHSSYLFEHFDCNEFTFKENEKISLREKADFQDVIDTNRPFVDQESDSEIDPNDGDGLGSGNYATREDAAALEGAIKENSRITRQDGESTRYAIDSGFSNTGRKLNKTNQILDDILKNTKNFDVDTTDIETKLDDIINQEQDYQDFVENKFEDFENVSAEKLSDFENVSVEDYYNTENFSGEIVEGEDFEAITPLSEQTFVQDFFSNNPVLSALSSSKIETQNAKCDFILVTSLGMHEMNLCFLESAFNNAGVILLSITTLFSLFVVVRK